MPPPTLDEDDIVFDKTKPALGELRWLHASLLPVIQDLLRAVQLQPENSSAHVQHLQRVHRSIVYLIETLREDEARGLVLASNE